MCLNNSILFTIYILFLFISGCATQVGLTYHTTPDGALISYQDGSQQHGISPVRVFYNWDEKYVKDGCLNTKGITAKWPSGAITSSPGIVTVCGGPGEYNYKLDRPSNVDGLEKDMNFALQVQRTRAIQKQAQQAGVQSELQMLQLFQSFNPPKKKVNNNISCNSRVVGSSVRTDCY